MSLDVPIRPIGYDCFTDSLSSYLYKDHRLSYCLHYVHPDMVFGIDDYKNYKLTMPVSQYFEPGDNLLMTTDPVNELIDTFYAYKNTQVDALLEHIKMKKVNVSRDSFRKTLHQIKSCAESFLLELDPYFLRDDYKRMGGVPSYIHTAHCVLLKEISDDTSECYIVDNQLRTQGRITIDKLEDAIQNMHTALFFYEETPPQLDDVKIAALFNHSLKCALQKAGSGLADRSFCVQTKAVRCLLDNIDEITEWYDHEYKLYAASFFLYPLKPFIHQLQGVASLYHMLSNKAGIIKETITRVAQSCESYARAWSVLDVVVSGLGLKKVGLSQKVTRIRKIVESIVQQSSNFEKLMISSLGSGIK